MAEPNFSYKPEFRHITKPRGRTAEPAAIDTAQPYPPELYNSIYSKDYLRKGNQKTSDPAASESILPAAKIGKTPAKKPSSKPFQLKSKTNNTNPATE